MFVPAESFHLSSRKKLRGYLHETDYFADTDFETIGKLENERYERRRARADERKKEEEAQRKQKKPSKKEESAAAGGINISKQTKIHPGRLIFETSRVKYDRFLYERMKNLCGGQIFPQQNTITPKQLCFRFHFRTESFSDQRDNRAKVWSAEKVCVLNA